MNRESVLVWRSLHPPKPVGCSALLVLLFFRLAQIFGDNLPNNVLFHVQLTCDHSNRQPTIATHLLSYPLVVNLSPACGRPRALIDLSPRDDLWSFCATQKLVCMTCFIFIHLLKHFKCLWWNFSQPDKIFQVYSFPSGHSWTTRKRRCK